MKFNNILNEEFEKFSSEERELIGYTMELINKKKYSDRSIEDKVIDKIDRILED